MDEKTINGVAVIVVLIFIASPIVIVPSYNIQVRAPAGKLVLSEKDLPGWKPNMTSDIGSLGYGWFGSPPMPVSEASAWFLNGSNGFVLAMAVKSFGSSGDARAFYRAGLASELVRLRQHDGRPLGRVDRDEHDFGFSGLRRPSLRMALVLRLQGGERRGDPDHRRGR